MKIRSSLMILPRAPLLGDRGIPIVSLAVLLLVNFLAAREDFLPGDLPHCRFWNLGFELRAKAALRNNPWKSKSISRKVLEGAKETRPFFFASLCACARPEVCRS
jgi:hypothetical protein